MQRHSKAPPFQDASVVPLAADDYIPGEIQGLRMIPLIGSVVMVVPTFAISGIMQLHGYEDRGSER